jgi:iron-sulfur cluster assembly protein
VAITLTENARNRVRALASEGLRIGIKRTGCSGLAYVVNTVDKVTDDDVVFEQDGVRVVVDRPALELIDGTVVDFVREGLNEAFRFRNPNAKGECGCGESFTV